MEARNTDTPGEVVFIKKRAAKYSAIEYFVRRGKKLRNVCQRKAAYVDGQHA